MAHLFGYNSNLLITLMRELKRQVRANKSGCLDQCEQGVVVVVYPEQVWYGGVQLGFAALESGNIEVAGIEVAKDAIEFEVGNSLCGELDHTFFKFTHVLGISHGHPWIKASKPSGFHLWDAALGTKEATRTEPESER